MLETLGGTWHPMGKRDRRRALEAWRTVYAAPLHQAIGRWKIGACEWHVFSQGYTRALNGARALARYEGEAAARVYLVPEDESWESGVLVNGMLPDFTGFAADVSVWPESLEWTMMFTHEEDTGVGPYFSRREWVS